MSLSTDTTLEEYENEGFTLKMHHTLSVHNSPEEFENAKITGHFGFVLDETKTNNSHYYRYYIVFDKPAFSDSSGFKNVFEKPVSVTVSVRGRLNRETKLRFQILPV